MIFVRKYKFWDWLSDLPRAQRSKMLNEMAAVAGISRRTLNTWVDAPLGSSLACPVDGVLAICVLLGKDSGTVMNRVAPTPAPAQLASAA